ncbi:MAG: endolytic transglycosylase MltG [Clostridia bacterium]|nr:endolytic transglycosylase MltG [Clostridia bacterium]
MASKQTKKGGALAGFLNTVSYILLILGVSLILSTFAILVSNDVLALVKEDNPVILTLTEDTASGQVASRLKQEGVIQYPWVFRLLTSLKKVDSFDAGTYELNSDMDYGQLISALRGSGEQRTVVRVTIPEGYTLQDICDLLVEKKVLTAEKFWETANTYPFSHAMLADVPMVDNRLEGYLFPDTYDFYVGDNAVNVINKMLNNFVKKYTKAMRNLTEANGLTIAEVVKVASLVEKEAKLTDERTTIAGVIYNRLHSSSFPYLQIDATIMYATGHKDTLTADDLKIDSPYNTYTHEGLPPTAICNPGVSCLMAAIQPEKTRYYYYVADTDGSHIFSRTLDEHNRAVAKVAAKSQ